MFSGSYKNSNFVNSLYEVPQANISVELNFDKIFAAVANIIERIKVMW